MTQMRRKKRAVSGVLLLDKPYNVTSNSALLKARWLFTAAKAGHTGVLDPLATGLLPVCLGEATKFSSYLLDADKGYRATICFGKVTTTGDLEGEVLRERPVTFDETALRRVLEQFVGPISQVPPMYSALKFQGKPLYEYARAGVDIERQARDVVIHGLELVSFDGGEAVVDVLCSKGTYVRTLAEDIGEALDCGAFLTGLRRTTTGGFTLEQSITLEALEAVPEAERDALLLPMDVLVAHLPEIVLVPEQAGRFRQGQAVRIAEKCETMLRFRVYLTETREFVGLGEVREPGVLSPLRLVAASAAEV
nr:tRNA pseudouridine(55) synthase TruB [uncultured Pseudogulbenkiania sp.]